MTEETIPFRIVAEEMAQAKYMIERPTLRDQFAMAALTGLLAALKYGNPADHIAKEAYAAADAMLEARKEKK